MLILLALPVIVAVGAVHRYLAFYAPSNLLVRRMRASRASWFGVLALLALSGALLVAMHEIADAVSAGAHGWLNLAVLVLAWDAIKFGLAAAQMGLRFARQMARRVVPQYGRSLRVTSTRRLARGQVQ